MGLEIPTERIVGLKLCYDPSLIGQGDEVRIKLVHNLNGNSSIKGKVEHKDDWSITINDDGTIWEIPWSNIIVVEQLP